MRDRTSERRSVWSLPSSWLGWGSIVFVLLSVALVFVPRSQPWGLTAALFLALIAGISALMLKKERSWLIWLAVALPAFVFVFEIVTIILPGAD